MKHWRTSNTFSHIQWHSYNQVSQFISTPALHRLPRCYTALYNLSFLGNQNKCTSKIPSLVIIPSQWKKSQGLFFWSELGSPVWNSQTMHSSHQQQQKGECIPLKNTYGLTLLQYGFAKSKFRNPCSSVKYKYALNFYHQGLGIN